jgi:hypothetical protein
MFPLSLFSILTTETEDAAVQTIHFITSPVFTGLGIALAIGTCIGIAISVRQPTFVQPIANVRMQDEYGDEVDHDIQSWFIAGFGLSLAVLLIPTLTQVHPMLGVIMFFVWSFGGGIIGGFLWVLFRVLVLRLVQGHRRLTPWLTIHRLRCRQCRGSLHLLASSASPEQLLNYLSPVERIASGKTQFAVWHCPSCYPDADRGQVNLRGYRRNGLLTCPHCQETTLKITGSHRDWQGDSEYEVTTFVCRYCSTETSHSRFVQGGDPS